MTYTEFKNTYRWMVKNYPETTGFYRENEFPIGDCEILNYEKENGKWILTESRTETGISNIYYCNVVDAIPFFRNLGGSERITKCYTRHGYIPVEISSISPDRQQKTVRKFNFQ